MTLDIYAERIIQHWEKPHNKGKLENASIAKHEENVSCGDQLTMYLRINDGKVEDVRFEGDGCAISMGSTSIMTDFIKGKTLKEIEKMDKKTVFEATGIEPGPARVHCATLPLRAIKEAVFEFENKKEDESTKEL